MRLLTFDRPVITTLNPALPEVLSVGVSVSDDDDMLTPTGPLPPPPDTAADTAHSAQSTQPALRPHRATPRVEDKPLQKRRPHSIGLCSPLSEGPDPGLAQRHVNAGSPVHTAYPVDLRSCFSGTWTSYIWVVGPSWGMGLRWQSAQRRNKSRI